jgi:hypothetical protein
LANSGKEESDAAKDDGESHGDEDDASVRG